MDGQGYAGSVLVEIGMLDEGAKLLREVFDHDPLPFDRAIAAAYLGLAALKREDAAGASEWFTAARELDPNCVPLKRLQPVAPQ